MNKRSATMTTRMLGLIVAGLFAAFCATSAVNAQATRTWLQGTGDDLNPCSRTAPCLTFSSAMSKTVAGGVVDVVDPGDFTFNAATSLSITRSMTLESVGQIAALKSTGVDAIDINGAGITVILRNLSIDGSGTGLAGINFINGSQLIIEHCDIGAFTGAGSAGILFAPSTAATLTIRDSTIHGNGVITSADSTGGILVQPAAGGSAQVILDNVRIVDNAGFGLKFNGPGTVALRNSVVAGNSGNGVWTVGSSSSAALTASDVAVSRNNQVGLLAQGAGAKITLRNSVVSGNAQGVQSSGAGAIVSYGNNGIYANLFDGAPDSTLSQH
jgi:Right handed beta helix region